MSMEQSEKIEMLSDKLEFVENWHREKLKEANIRIRELEDLIMYIYREDSNQMEPKYRKLIQENFF
jgi:hypothetical protein